MNRRLKIILTLCAAGLLIFYTIDLVKGTKKATKDNIDALGEDLGTINTHPGDYSSLFSKNVFKRMRHVTTWLNKIREPIAFFVYENKFNIVIHKTKVDTSFSFNRNLNIQKKATGVSNRVSYRITGDGDYFRLSFYGKKNSTMNSIYLIIDGNPVNEISLNDTLVSYNLLCRNLSVGYLPNDTVDFALQRTKRMFGSSPLISLDFSMRKKDGWIYYFFMFPIDPKDGVKETELDNIIRLGNDG